MAPLGPLYLIHGDDHGGIAERRANLRALAESQAGDGTGVELLEGADATPAGTAQALSSLTLSFARRVLIVDGVERWRAKDIEGELAAALAQIPADTTLAMFAREDARAKVPDALVKEVKKAGGQVSTQATVKRRELPKWVQVQGARVGLDLDQDAARTLIARVGERQQRLLRELEKFALWAGEQDARVRVSADEVAALAARSADSPAYALADALLARDERAAMAIYLRLRAQGERLPGLLGMMARRLREALSVVQQLGAGVPAAKIKDTLGMPPWVAERFIAQVRGHDPARLRAALELLADLEVGARGGSPLPALRDADAGLEDDTLALRAIERIAAA